MKSNLILSISGVIAVCVIGIVFIVDVNKTMDTTAANRTVNLSKLTNKYPLIDKEDEFTPDDNWTSALMIVVDKREFQWVKTMDRAGVEYEITWLKGVHQKDLIVGEPVTVHIFKDNPSIIKITQDYYKHN